MQYSISSLSALEKQEAFEGNNSITGNLCHITEGQKKRMKVSVVI